MIRSNIILKQEQTLIFNNTEVAIKEKIQFSKCITLNKNNYSYLKQHTHMCSSFIIHQDLKLNTEKHSFTITPWIGIVVLFYFFMFDAFLYLIRSQKILQRHSDSEFRCNGRGSDDAQEKGRKKYWETKGKMKREWK